MKAPSMLITSLYLKRPKTILISNFPSGHRTGEEDKTVIHREE